MSARDSSQQLLLDLSFHKEYSRENLVIGTSNEQAVKYIDAWPDWPSPYAAIIGEEGCGKTHLGHIWQEKSQALWVDPTALPNLDLVYSSQHIVIDGGNIIKDEDWLFHVYNIAFERQSSILILDSIPPTQWTIRLADLKSRLRTFVCLPVTLPDDAMLQALLIKLFYETSLRPNQEVIDYLLKRMPRSYKELHNIVRMIDRYTLRHHKELTIPVVKEALRTILI